MTNSQEPGSDLSKASVGRMSLYLRELRRLDRDGVATVRSRQLGVAAGVSDAIVRRDLSQVGTLGRRGRGYPVRGLIESLRGVLGINQTWNSVLIGAGSLGNALIRYRGFSEQGFQLVAAFDVLPHLIGQRIAGVEILPLDLLDETVERRGVSLAIIAVPADAAPEIGRRLADSGVRGILNFAPANLQLSGSVSVVNVDLASELQRLSFAVVRASLQPERDEAE